ncbi:MAG: hypothetical protein Q4Q58_05965 [Thermoplasmata archaeon]|nr:hypothetical protein [Thermoplasmata archaeon]
MPFDSDPQTMRGNGQQWFAGDYARLRWWVKEGSYGIIRPNVPEDECTRVGYPSDILWTNVGHLDHKIGNGIFAEWIVGRADLGINITATKLEVALDGYYTRLGESFVGGVDKSVSSAIGRDEMKAILEQFSSRAPGFCILSDEGKAPIVFDIDDRMNDTALACENINPMKRSVFYRDRQVNGD